MSEFQEKVVIITGGGGGIGKAAAARFLDEGASVVLSSRRLEVLEVARRELGADDRIALVARDVSSPGAAGELIDSAVDRFGGIDVLVNCTGIFRVTPFLEQTEEQFEEALDSILRPTFYTSQAAARAMVESGGGAIINVGSMWALDAIAATPTSAYSAAQAGRHALTKNLAIELAGANIRVNTVALAFVETPAYERFMTAEQAREVLDATVIRPTSSRRSSFSPAIALAGSRERRSRSTGASSPAETRPRRPFATRPAHDPRHDAGAHCGLMQAPRPSLE